MEHVSDFLKHNFEAYRFLKQQIMRNIGDSCFKSKHEPKPAILPYVLLIDMAAMVVGWQGHRTYF
jgi:hypothetical protein